MRPQSSLDVFETRTNIEYISVWTVAVVEPCGKNPEHDSLEGFTRLSVQSTQTQFTRQTNSILVVNQRGAYNDAEKPQLIITRQVACKLYLENGCLKIVIDGTALKMYFGIEK